MGTEESIIYSYDLATIPSVLPAFANAKDLIVCDEVRGTERRGTQPAALLLLLRVLLLVWLDVFPEVPCVTGQGVSYSIQNGCHLSRAKARLAASNTGNVPALCLASCVCMKDVGAKQNRTSTSSHPVSAPVWSL